jgi:hypothetical protein
MVDAKCSLSTTCITLAHQVGASRPRHAGELPPHHACAPPPHHARGSRSWTKLEATPVQGGDRPSKRAPGSQPASMRSRMVEGERGLDREGGREYINGMGMAIISGPRGRLTRRVWACVQCGRTHRRYRGETECILRCGCGSRSFVKGTETAPENRG